jgi:O-antigen/teichoic acid export membrane protein
LLVRFLNEYEVGDRPDLTKGLLLSSFRISAVAMLIAIAAVALVAHFRGDLWLLILAVSAYTAVSAGLMLGSQIARSLVSIIMGEGNREFFWRVFVVLFLLAMLFGHRQLDPAELIAAMTIAMSVGLVAQIIAIVRALPDLRATAANSEATRWRSSALHFWLASILEVANQYFDVILVYWMLDPTTAGIYFAASRLANIFAMLSAALYSFGARRLPSLYFSKNHQEFERTLRLMAEVTAVCVVSGLFLIWVGGPHLLNLFGPHFAAQHWVLIVLAIGTAFQAAGGPSAAILQLTGYEREYVPVIAGNVALRLVGFLVLIPWLGVLGAAISATVSLALATIALNILCRRRTGVDPSVLGLLRFSASKRSAYAIRGADSGE